MRAPNFENPNAALASLPAAPDLKFEREDWSLFRTVEGLQQKAGVAKDKLSRLVLKELADNGLDPGAGVEVGELPGGGYFVDDSGPGIDGTPVEIAALFSIRRPMVSTKLLRLPQRGALGNGCGSSLAPFWPPAAPSASSPATSGSYCGRSAMAAQRSSLCVPPSGRPAPVSRSASARRSRATPARSIGRSGLSGWRGQDRATPASRRRTGMTSLSSTSCSRPAVIAPYAI